MTQKRENTLMHKLVCLSMLLQENLDELNPTTERMKTLKITLTEFTEVLNNELKTTDTIMRTTYFQDISNKIDTILRKNFDETK